MLKLKKLDALIVLLMFALLPIDMINGIMLRNAIILPITLGQVFKLIIIAVLFFRFFIFNFKLLVTSFLMFLMLLAPTFYQILIHVDASFLFSDIIKVSKYLTPLFSFFFFRDYINRQDAIELKQLFKLVRFSYIILVVNILIKYIGLGYPMYRYGDIGSKGFFYAGNETSALLIILSAILAHSILLTSKRWKFYAFMTFSLVVGISIGSKTGVLGILLLMLLIPIKQSSIRLSSKGLQKLNYKLFAYVPLIGFGAWLALKSSAGYERISYFWNKLDVLTFVFSHRNFFFLDAYKVFKEKYKLMEMFIGVGQTKYEFLNNSKIIEIDIADIFFTYGLMGILLFIFLIEKLLTKSFRFSKIKEYKHTNFVFLMVFILLGISSISGHVFSSGMSAIFIGLLFSLMYLKNYGLAKK